MLTAYDKSQIDKVEKVGNKKDLSPRRQKIILEMNLYPVFALEEYRPRLKFGLHEYLSKKMWEQAGQNPYDEKIEQTLTVHRSRLNAVKSPRLEGG